jgi:rod shape determining protein RodA
VIIKGNEIRKAINLYILVLQPSELMKIGIILCLAKYYHRLRPEKVNSFVSISVPLTLIIIPIILFYLSLT